LHFATHLVVVLLVLVVAAFFKKPSLHRFKWGWDEIWLDFSLSEYALDRVGFSI